MSKPMIISEQIDGFMDRHPSQEGWKIYALDTALADDLGLAYLLDYLRDRDPEALRYQYAIKYIEADEMLGTLGKAHTVSPGTAWDLDKELNGACWGGVIQIEWMGCPIHYYWFTDDADSDCHTLVATKSNAALQGFSAVLQVYAQERDKRQHREVIVVNGPRIRVPSVIWDDVILPHGMTEEIQVNVGGFFQSRARYQELDIPFRRGFLFTGPPGCGKTLALKALINSTDVSIVTVLTRSDVDDSDIERAFDLANRLAPCIVIFEDLDRLVHSAKISMSFFLNLLDGLKPADSVLVIATSNHPEMLDPALLYRPSRFDRIWRFPLPDNEMRLALLRRKRKQHFSDKALRRAAAESNGFSMAYVQEIVVNAFLQCAHAAVRPEDEHLLNSLQTLKAQRKDASKPEEEMSDRESLGFCVPDRRRPSFMSRDFGEDEPKG